MGNRDEGVTNEEGGEVWCHDLDERVQGSLERVIVVRRRVDVGVTRRSWGNRHPEKNFLSREKSKTS